MPVDEAVHRVTRRRATVRLRSVEDAEVARLLPLTGGPRQADVVTVMATYQRPERLRLAVASALAQPVEDHLVVVVNDGGEPPLLASDPRLLCVDLSRNTGCAGVVRNVGIRLTQSRLVAFLDDDNTWLPRHLPAAVAAHAQGCDLSYSDIAWRGEHGEDFGVLAETFRPRALAHHNYLDLNSIVVRRGPATFFSRQPRLRSGFAKEDWELAWRLRRGRVCHIEEMTAVYLVNPQSYFTSHDALLSGDLNAAPTRRNVG